MGSKTSPKLEKSSFKGSLVSRSLETSGPEDNIFQAVKEASEAVLLCKHYRREEPKRPKDFWDADSMHSALRVLAQKMHLRKYQCPTLNGVCFLLHEPTDGHIECSSSLLLLFFLHNIQIILFLSKISILRYLNFNVF